MLVLLLTRAFAAPEICDTVDNDGDGTADEAPVMLFEDNDGDGRGDPGTPVFQATCVPQSGNVVTNSDDCDDGNGGVYAGATETCNGIDDDCDGAIDEDGCPGGTRSTRNSSTYQTFAAGNTWNEGRAVCQGIGYDLPIIGSNVENDYLIDIILPLSGTYFWTGLWDPDGTDVFEWVDGSAPTYTNWYGSEPNQSSRDCSVAWQGDRKWEDYPCDFTSGSTHTICEVQCTPRTWYQDDDGDGFGDDAIAVSSCDQPVGHVANPSDCNDGDAAINPTATEVCGGGDEDCDPTTNGTGSTWYLDSDSDGFGDPLDSISACAEPAGRVADATDCDDGDATAFPGAMEVCDGDLEDCNGSVDDGLQSTFYLDQDEDGFGSVAAPVQACSQPGGYVADATDCDDEDATAYPGAPEVCDGDLEDCNGSVDHGLFTTFFEDIDGDGFGTTAQTAAACTVPDGFSATDGDCDDMDGTAYPGAPEECDGDLEDCDGTVDQGVLNTYYEDVDDDGFGHSGVFLQACSEPAGYAATATDCDDGDATAYPGATEVCDGDLEDCEGTIDEGVLLTFYEDDDADGFGNVDQSMQACSQPSGFVASNTDCDDSDASAFPGATEVCDGDLEDCDGTIDDGLQQTFWLDADEDGYGAASGATSACSAPTGFVTNGTDCDDADDTAFPGAPEVCDGDLEACGGVVDDGVTLTFFRDVDADGFGDPDDTVQACAVPGGYALAGDDCNDNEPLAWNGAVEACDEVDNDCDGQTDEGVTLTFWRDTDNDGFGDAADDVQACAAPAGTVPNDEDCDDARAEAYPNATEICNNLDDDCDGQVDNDTNDVQWYEDLDEDGVGGAQGPFQCSEPEGHVAVGGDCDDDDPNRSPLLIEVCDGVDNDCDTMVDEDASDATPWFPDSDADGYGDGTAVVLACSQPSGTVVTPGDCDDTSDTINPDAIEVCDLVDNDCNGVTDLDAPHPTAWYVDGDQDGYGGVDGDPILQCAPVPGRVADNTDCNDTYALTYPGASELCDDADNDCDGAVDNDVVDQQYYFDDDGDNYGAAPGQVDCVPPAGQVPNDTDCDDTNDLVSPAGTEVCNGLDDDCDGIVDADAVVGTSTWYEDLDGDGYGDLDASVVACTQPSATVDDATDCDDTNADVFPGATELCNDADDNCDGTPDDGLPDTDWFPDLDGDGFGDSQADPRADCAPASDEVDDATDCDDTTASVNPDATDVPDNGVDEDCDGTDATGPLPPTPTDEPVDTGDTAGGRVIPARDAGCQCDVAGEPSIWTSWLRR